MLWPDRWLVTKDRRMFDHIGKFPERCRAKRGCEVLHGFRAEELIFGDRILSEATEQMQCELWQVVARSRRAGM